MHVPRGLAGRDLKTMLTRLEHHHTVHHTSIICNNRTIYARILSHGSIAVCEGSQSRSLFFALYETDEDCFRDSRMKSHKFLLVYGASIGLQLPSVNSAFCVVVDAMVCCATVISASLLLSSIGREKNQEQSVRLV